MTAPRLRDGVSCRSEITLTYDASPVSLNIIMHLLHNNWHKGVTKDQFAEFLKREILTPVPVSNYTTTSTIQTCSISSGDWVALETWAKENT